jgi:hypothetical protein
LTSLFEVIVQTWLALFPASLQMESEPPSNAKPCGTGAPHDMAFRPSNEDMRGLRRGVCYTHVLYWEDEE